MERVTQFQAIYERMNTDRDGETKFTVTIPLSDLPAVLKAALIIGETVIVTVDRKSGTPDGRALTSAPPASTTT